MGTRKIPVRMFGIRFFIGDVIWRILKQNRSIGSDATFLGGTKRRIQNICAHTHTLGYVCLFARSFSFISTMANLMELKNCFAQLQEFFKKKKFKRQISLFLSFFFKELREKILKMNISKDF